MRYAFTAKILLPVVLFFWFAVAGFTAAGQTISQPIRLELEANDFEDLMDVTPLPDSSLLVYRRPHYGSFKDKHSFRKFDRNLKQQWETVLELNDDQAFNQIYASNNFIYILYLDRIPGRFHLLKINATNGQNQLTRYNLKDFEIERDVQLGQFKVLNDQIFIMAQTTRNALVIHLDLKTNQLKTIPALYDQLSAISEFHVDTISARAEFVLAESNGVKGRLYVKRFSPAGNLYTTNFILPAFKKNLITAQLSPGDSASKVLVGSFSSRNLTYAQGLFTSPLITTENSIKYYDFLQFKHFFDFMGKGARRRLEARAARYEAKNKELKQRFRLLFHDLKLQNDTLYLFAEAYSTVTNNSRRLLSRTVHNIPIYGVYGPNIEPNPAEIKYSHSFVCAFDKQGNLLWDNNYVLKDVSTHELLPVVQHAFVGDKIVMAYAYKEDIRYKVINRDQTSDNELSVPLAGQNQEDKLSDPEEADLLHWYGSHFITYGFQRVRPAGGSGQEVFYLNKVSFSR